MHFSLAEKRFNPQLASFGRLAAFGSFLCLPSLPSGWACINSAAPRFGGCGLYPLWLLGLWIARIDFCIFALF